MRTTLYFNLGLRSFQVAPSNLELVRSAVLLRSTQVSDVLSSRCGFLYDCEPESSHEAHCGVGDLE